RLLMNCSLDCSLPRVSILRMYSLQPLLPRWHSLFGIKSVNAIPFVRQMQCVSSCYLPNPTTRVRQPLRLCEIVFALAQGFFCPLCLCHVSRRPHKLAVAGCILYCVGQGVDVLDTPVRQ